MITINWTGTRVDEDDYYKVGEWSLDGEVMGLLESPADSNFVSIYSDEDIILMLEGSLL